MSLSDDEIILHHKWLLFHLVVLSKIFCTFQIIHLQWMVQESPVRKFTSCSIDTTILQFQFFMINLWQYLWWRSIVYFFLCHGGMFALCQCLAGNQNFVASGPGMSFKSVVYTCFILTGASRYDNVAIDFETCPTGKESDAMPWNKWVQLVLMDSLALFDFLVLLELINSFWWI